MFKGALLLAFGYTVGHAKGLSENTVFITKMEEIITRINAWVETQENVKQENTSTEEQDESERDEVPALEAH
jgi:hypothetical protein